MFEVNKQEFVDVTSTYFMPLKEDMNGDLLFILCYDTNNKITKTYTIPITKVGLKIHTLGLCRDERNNEVFNNFGWTCNFVRRQQDGKVYLDIQIADLNHFFNSRNPSKVICFTEKEFIGPHNLLDFTLQI
ncbi:MAG: hypothetical protein J6U02_03950 [Elusimicrobia bacterium]|nr:hypothetical protein [Elusimicrobiota bacterium]